MLAGAGSLCDKAVVLDAMLTGTNCTMIFPDNHKAKATRLRR